MNTAGEPFRGEMRRVGYRRVSHGLHLPRTVGGERNTELEFRRDLEAWLLVLPPGAAFTHLTAARLYGWWLPPPMEFVPVFAAVSGDSPRPRRVGLIVSRLRRDECHEWRDGLPLDRPEEVLLRASRDLGVLDILVLLTSAIRSGDVTQASVAKTCASGRPGVRRLRAALAACDARCESAWEVILRAFHVLVGVAVTPQQEFHDESGQLVARVDLWLDGTHLVNEYDGAHHRTPHGQQNDLRRDRRLAQLGIVRRAFTAEDLLRRELATLHEIDRSIGRAHRPGRILPWRAWVAGSTYSTSGRQRIVNRWRVLSGFHDWSATAPRAG